jgi:nifR3 family TIM-barrel protein
VKLTDPWTLGGLPVPNRVVLAPLAGIGNWFVRLQAKRFGAGMVVSEMVSSFAIHYGNERTLRELLRIDPREREHARPGPIAIQLFGHDPEVMRSAAATVAEAGADLIDLNMGCPVPKVMKTGAGAALPRDPAKAVAIARAAAEGSGLPVTVKLRAEGVPAARALVEDGCVAGITFHPRNVKVRHKGTPDYELAAQMAQELPVPVIVSGGMAGAEHIRWVFAHTGCAAVMLARGALGNPWLFEEVLGTRTERPAAEEIVREWLWVLDRAVEHLGEPRAWYVERLGAGREAQNTLQRAGSVAEQRSLIRALAPVLSSTAA